MALRDISYLDFDDITEWLKIRDKLVGLANDTKAKVIIQDLEYTAKLNGENGSDISIEYVDGTGDTIPVTAGNEVVEVSGETIVVRIEPGVSKADQIKTKVDTDTNANKLVSILVTGTGSNTQLVQAEKFLTGGAFSADHKPRLVRMLEQLIDSACAWAETYVGSPLKIREFTEIQDGASSNVISPHHWPVIEVTDLRIDFNRDFTDASKLNSNEFFLRGKDYFAKLNLTSQSPEIHFVGQDIVLRDDDENFVIGRIFPGSIVGSIRIVYKAGRGNDPTDMPSDILQATTQLVEYWYYQRENRDIGVTTKGVKGESYTKISASVPTQITDLLDRYQDASLGTHQMPQRNRFGI